METAPGVFAFASVFIHTSTHLPCPPSLDIPPPHLTGLNWAISVLRDGSLSFGHLPPSYRVAPQQGVFVPWRSQGSRMTAEG